MGFGFDDDEGESNNKVTSMEGKEEGRGLETRKSNQGKWVNGGLIGVDDVIKVLRVLSFEIGVFYVLFKDDGHLVNYTKIRSVS